MRQPEKICHLVQKKWLYQWYLEKAEVDIPNRNAACPQYLRFLKPHFHLLARDPTPFIHQKLITKLEFIAFIQSV